MKFMRPAVGGAVNPYAIALERADGIAFLESEFSRRRRFRARASGMVATAPRAD